MQVYPQLFPEIPGVITSAVSHDFIIKLTKSRRLASGTQKTTKSKMSVENLLCGRCRRGAADFGRMVYETVVHNWAWRLCQRWYRYDGGLWYSSDGGRTTAVNNVADDTGTVSQGLLVCPSQVNEATTASL